MRTLVLEQSLLKYLFFLALILGGCQSSRSIFIFTVAPGVFQYYVPATQWYAQELDARLDITYRDMPGEAATCNISVINTRAIPRGVSEAFFTAGGKTYPIRDIKRLLVDVGKSTLRVTGKLSGEDLREAFAPDAVTLTLVVDGVRHVCAPPNLFLAYGKELLLQLTI
jgi:hypothetical protein